MMIQLRTVTPENLEAVIGLQVKPEQQSWVAPNVKSLAEAGVNPQAVPLAVYAGEEPVGFALYNVEEDGVVWVCRLMIDAAHQGKGYGRQALQKVLARIRKSLAPARVFLSVEPENEGAIRLYQSLGFQFDGRVLEGERVMKLELGPEDRCGRGETDSGVLGGV